jgi:hypothetical protein
VGTERFASGPTVGSSTASSGRFAGTVDSMGGRTECPLGCSSLAGLRMGAVDCASGGGAPGEWNEGVRCGGLAPSGRGEMERGPGEPFIEGVPPRCARCRGGVPEVEGIGGVIVSDGLRSNGETGGGFE